MSETNAIHRILNQIDKQVTNLINTLSSNENRYILGITGIPAVGKSTTAVAIEKQVNHHFEKEIAIVVPMDGFHLYDDELRRRDLYPLKGAYQTFDGHKFVDLLARLKNSPTQATLCPKYDRNISHDPIEDAIVITPKHKLIIVEGNYLLLNIPPWDKIKELLDKVWFLETSRETTVEHLMKRHRANGKSIQEAKDKIASTDSPNSDIIQETKSRADEVIYIKHETGLSIE